MEPVVEMDARPNPSSSPKPSISNRQEYGSNESAQSGVPDEANIPLADEEAGEAPANEPMSPDTASLVASGEQNTSPDESTAEPIEPGHDANAGEAVSD